MRLIGIKISNFLGLAEYEVKPGKKVTVVEGKNATGKSSLIQAIRSALSFGHDATLLRKGSKEAEVILVLDDGTEIKKRITESKSDVQLRLPDAGRVSAPKKYLERLLDVFGLDPVAFLTAKPDRRAELLIESMPLEVTVSQLNAILPPSLHVSKDQVSGHALEVIARIIKTTYDERTGVNRLAKAAGTAVEEASKALPKDDGLDWTLLLKEADEELKILDEELEAALEVVKEEADQDIQKATEESIESIQLIETEYQKVVDDNQAAIQRLQKEIDFRKGVLSQEAEKRKSDVSLVQTNLQSTKERIALRILQRQRAARDIQDPARDTLRKKRADLSAKRDASLGAQSLRDMIKKHKEEQTINETASTVLTRALNDLEELKQNLLSQLPVKDIEIRNGEVYVYEHSISDWIPYDRANEARKVQIAIELAKSRASKGIPLIVVDRMESLDKESFALFEEGLIAAEKDGYQVIMARVTDDEQLTVRTV